MMRIFPRIRISCSNIQLEPRKQENIKEELDIFWPRWVWFRQQDWSPKTV